MNKRILLVDDSEVFRKIVRTFLHSSGFEIIEKENGQEALDYLLTGEKIHLVISDVNMPVMDGLTFVNRLRELEDRRFVPVIMLTTVSEEEKIRRGREAGVKAWLIKPFSPEVLKEAVSKILP